MQAFVTEDLTTMQNLNVRGVEPHEKSPNGVVIYWDLDPNLHHFFEKVNVCIWPDGDWDFESNMTSTCSCASYKSNDYTCANLPYWVGIEDIEDFVPFYLQSNQSEKDVTSWFNQMYKLSVYKGEN